MHTWAHGYAVFMVHPGKVGELFPSALWLYRSPALRLLRVLLSSWWYAFIILTTAVNLLAVATDHYRRVPTLAHRAWAYPTTLPPHCLLHHSI